MVNLTSVGTRFEVPFTVIEGGSGTVMGVVGEAEQNSQPSYVFNAPRLIFRVRTLNLLRPGVVLQSPDGHVYLAGYNGPSENHNGHLWDSFRLFLATKKVSWKRRGKTIDVVTGLERDSGLQTLGDIWVTVEQIDRESYDRKIGAASFESARFLSAANVLADDQLDGRQVTRSDLSIGLKVGSLL